jgi:TIR domain
MVYSSKIIRFTQILIYFVAKQIMALHISILNASADIQHKKDLIKHLSALRRSGKINIWSDDDLLPGAVFKQETRDALSRADMIVYLLSSDFMAEDSLWDNELALSLERRAKGDAVMLVPILVSPCDIQGTFLANIQGLPRNKKAISEQDADAAWSAIAKEIGGLVEHYPAEIERASAAANQPSTTTTTASNSIISSKNIISGSIIIVGGNLTIGDSGT